MLPFLDKGLCSEMLNLEVVFELFDCEGSISGGWQHGAAEYNNHL